MSNRLKSILLVIGTLIIGMILGSLLTSTLVKAKMKKMSHTNIEERHINFFYNSIEVEPGDLPEVDAVLNGQIEKSKEIDVRFHQERNEFMEATKTALEPHLTEAQKQQLIERLEQLKKRVRNHKGRHHRGIKKRRRGN